MQEIYLDNSATTKPLESVIEVMMDYYRHYYGNPSSMHKMGIEAEKGIKEARRVIANFLKVEETEVVFTSGGTEANNIAIKGILNRNKKKGKHIITTKIEHPSVLNVLNSLEYKEYEVSYLNVNNEGEISLDELKAIIREDTILVSIMMVNNEVGTVQPIRSIGEIISKYDNCFFHVDGVQAFGKVHCYPKELGIDLLSVSSHKAHGPKGVGVLYMRKNILIEPLLLGGGQEYGMRSGTENVPAIIGMGKAVEYIDKQLEKKMKLLYKLREKGEKEILKTIKDVYINGPHNPEKTAPHILSVSFDNIKGEVLLHSLEQDNIYISTGSACSSKKNVQSYVLKNMGISDSLIEGTMRISFSIFNTEEEIDSLVESLNKHINLLREIRRR